MKEKIINYIETLEAKAYQSDDYFKQRNELYIENQKKDELISSLRQHLIEEHNQKKNIIEKLEKEIDRLLERQYESERFAKEHGFDTYLPAKQNLLCVKNKLQELKGSISNENL